MKRIALVTGGSRGIGAAVAKRLAADGLTVAITYSASAEQALAVVSDIEKSGGRAMAIKADAGNPEEVRAAVDQVAKTFGSVDVLVNNAGVYVTGTIDEAKLDDVQRMFDVNITGVYVATQAALKYMKEGGRIVNVGSLLSERVPFAGAVAYALTKGAVSTFNRALAREVGARGITVNSVLPGPTDTAMNPKDGPAAAFMHSTMAIPRHLTADEIAGAVAYFVRPEAAGTTGAELLVDGGMSA